MSESDFDISYTVKVNGKRVRGDAIVTGEAPTCVFSVEANVPVAWFSENYNSGDPDGDGKSSVKIGEREWRYQNDLGPGKHPMRWNYPGGGEGGHLNFTYEQVKPVEPPQPFLNATIADQGPVATNVAYMDALGYDTMRIWAQWHNVTGALTNADLIANIKAYNAADKRVIICLTPTTGVNAVAFPSAAIASIKASGIDKSKVWIQVINECNLDYYWPGDELSAWEMAVRVAGELRPDGWIVFGPSWTWNDAPSLDTKIAAVEAKGYLQQVDGIDLHCYPTLDAASKNKDGTVTVDAAKLDAKAVEFNRVAEVGQKRAKKNGILFIMSEYGMYAKNTEDFQTFPAFLPKIAAIVKARANAAAYFIMRYIAKHAKYRLHLVDESGTYNTLGVAAAKANGKAVAVPAAGK